MKTLVYACLVTLALVVAAQPSRVNAQTSLINSPQQLFPEQGWRSFPPRPTTARSVWFGGTMVRVSAKPAPVGRRWPRDYQRRADEPNFVQAPNSGRSSLE